MKIVLKNSLVAIALVSAISVTLFATSAEAAITLPKGSWPVCLSAIDAYCVESVTVTREGVTPVTLSYGSAGSAMTNADISTGKALSGRWSSADWTNSTFGALGYDGIFVDAHQVNEYVPWVYLDVQPTLGTSLAVQTSNKNFAANLDKDVSIGVKLHLGTIQTGVTFGVGQNVTTEIKTESGITTILIDGYPTTVPVSASSKDCTGSVGKAVALVNQFQSVIVPQNDPLGFGVDGGTGNLYVGSNGTCKLSTPVWNQETKHFRYAASAPALSPDGLTTNKGFYHAVISYADAKTYWGLTKPQDAAQALAVSIITSSGGSTAATATISAKNNFITIDTANFDFPDAQLDIALNSNYNRSSAGPDATNSSAGPDATNSSASAGATATSSVGKANQTVKKPISKVITITCVKGTLKKKISGLKPVCPKGFIKK